MKITFDDYIRGNTVKPGREPKIGDVIKDSEGNLILIGLINIKGEGG